MWGQEQNTKQRNLRIFIVSIDGVIRDTYKTGVRDFIYVPFNEARRAIERKIKEGEGNGYYLATDDQTIAKEYNLKLLEIKYK
ncbi:hypothetical protein J4448_00455 [Candidatus Woesearchaeota archaeon]|nr:hypothetical protein [Candidatus Woesearchaeota archaeon]